MILFFYFFQFIFLSSWRTFYVQIGLVMIAVSTLIISGSVGYRSLCMLAWAYGLGLGSYRYALKMLALERVRAKYFTKAWGNFYKLIKTESIRKISFN